MRKEREEEKQVMFALLEEGTGCSWESLACSQWLLQQQPRPDPLSAAAVGTARMAVGPQGLLPAGPLDCSFLPEVSPSLIEAQEFTVLLLCKCQCDGNGPARAGILGGPSPPPQRRF